MTPAQQAAPSRWRVDGRKPLLAMLAVVLFLAAVEGVLRLAGYTSPLPPLIVEGAAYDAEGRGEVFVADPELLWAYRPGSMLHGRRINQLGFPEREVDAALRPGVQRVICMGDSCTAEGRPPYSTLLHERLLTDPPGEGRWAAFHMAVHGYSVVQGLRLFQARVHALQPRVVTLYFGWNDHWRAAHSDRLRMDSLQAGLGRRLADALRRRRFFQLMVQLLPRPAAPESGGHLRVPPAEYAATLTALVEAVRASGATPLLMTAPRAERMHSALVERGHGASLDQIKALHDQYVERTRVVADETATPLLDLAATLPAEPAFARMFHADGIHLRALGREHVADAIYTGLKQLESGPRP